MSAYVETSSGNRVSRASVLCGAARIRLDGRVTLAPGATLRGDLARVGVGRFAHIGARSVLRPCHKVVRDGQLTFFPLAIGAFVLCGADCHIAAALIESHVRIGDRAVLGERSIVKHASVILPDSVLAADTVVPPLAIMGGSPARIVGWLPESTALLVELEARRRFERFKNE